MKKDSFFKPSPAFIAALMITFTIFVPVFAAPNTPPPNANVGANFYSVKAGDVTISNNGDISDATGSVTINDAEGLRSISTTAGNAGVYGEGTTNGINGKANGTTGTGGQFEGPTTGITATSNRSGGTGGYFSNFGNINRVSLGTTNYAVDAQGASNFNGNVTSSGHIKAAGGIGKFLSYSATSPLIAPGAFGTAKAVCPSGQEAVSCGYVTLAPANVWQLNQFYTTESTDECIIYGRNSSATTSYTISARLICFDPNQ